MFCLYLSFSIMRVDVSLIMVRSTIDHRWSSRQRLYLAYTCLCGLLTGDTSNKEKLLQTECRLNNPQSH